MVKLVSCAVQTPQCNAGPKQMSDGGYATVLLSGPIFILQKTMNICGIG